MRFIAIATILAQFMLAPAAAQDTDDLESLREQAVLRAVARVAPSVVRIETVGGLEQVQGVLTPTGPTTGLIVSDDGLVITSSFNFAHHPASILVTLPDGRRFPAREIASDHSRMLTLLEIVDDEGESPEANEAGAADQRSEESEGSRPGGGTYPVPEVLAESDIRVGQSAIALGRTYEGELPSISVGIVSALGRVWGKAIQTDAKTSPVNYGGPLVDLHGRVMGVIVPLSPEATGEVAGVEWYDSGIGFAVPLEDIYAVLPRLRSGEDLHPGLAGITLAAGNQYADPPRIDRVRYGSPAHEAGLAEGDEIVAIDDQAVVRSVQVRQLLGNRYAGDVVRVRVRRGEEERTGELTLVEVLPTYEWAFLGILPGRDREPGGVRVRYVYPEGPAAAAGIEAGDRIVALDGAPPGSREELADLVGRRRPEDEVVVSVESGGEARELRVTLGGVPEGIPEPLDAEIGPASDPDPGAGVPATVEEGEEIETGHVVRLLEGYEREYWAYVPADYDPALAYGLVLWIDPDGRTMEDEIVRRWGPVCDARGFVLAGARRAPGEAEADDHLFLRAVLDDVLSRYSVDRARVAVHGFSQGASAAYRFAFENGERVRGAAAIAGPIQSEIRELEPERRLQFYLAVGEQDRLARAVEASAEQLREAGYPAVLRIVPEASHVYLPGDEDLDALARWLDALDRI